MLKHWKGLFLFAAVAAAGWVGYAAHEAQGGKSVETRVFEMRTYHTEPGRMDALHARFRDHTNKLFKKHGMTMIGYWVPLDAKEAEQKLIYILAYPSKEARDKSWKDFQADPVWKAAKEASEKDGKIVARVESIFLKPTDYSAIK
jgi:hypothetical protein